MIAARLSSHPPGSGAVPTLLVLVVVTAFVGRGFSYLFVWPLFAVTIATAVPHREPWQRILRFTLVASTVMLLTVPAIDVFLQFANPRPGNLDSSTPATIVVPLLLVQMAIGLLGRFWPGVGTTEADRSGPSRIRRQPAHIADPL